MKISNNEALIEFMHKHKDVSELVKTWRNDVKAATWDSPHALKECFPKASIIGSGCVVFDIKGNKYRIVTKIKYKLHIVNIRWCGKHTEYNKLDLRSTKCLSPS
ncbi:MAG: type II toxin-antitoxin system HigB family toxin [Candidatus Cloacimonetes bacterium]|nr:type II toxin-antitoxin system HigB family toxin [Candidatus Cloacimonadota bacterium]